MKNYQMNAYQLHEFGDLSKLREQMLPEPPLTAKQVLVRRLAIAVEPYDVHFCAGTADSHILPVIPGSSIAGEVVAVGKSVTAVEVGDWVVAARYLKTYAEYVPVNQSDLALIPKSLTPSQAVSLAVSGQTVYQMIRHHLQPLPGQKVLIHGGMGAVGQIALQLAVNAGADVYTTARTENVTILMERYPEITVIDYTKTTLAEFGVLFDNILDTVGGETLQSSIEALAPKGKLVSIVAEPATRRMDVTVSAEYLDSDGADLSALLNMIVSGVVVLPPMHEVTLNLTNLRLGHELVGSGHYDQKYVLVESILNE